MIHYKNAEEIELMRHSALLVSQALTLFTTPVIYLWLERLFHRPVHQPGSAPTAALATTD